MLCGPLSEDCRGARPHHTSFGSGRSMAHKPDAREDMRIAFVIPTLRAGGAERVASLLCNFWVERGFPVAVLTFEAPGADAVCALDARVVLRQLDLLNQSRNPLSILATNRRRLRRLRAALQEFKPDAVVAFTTEANVVALWAAAGLGVPVVVAERNQPDRPGLGPVRR